MPSDEELRKVAEDVRALARSLARDVWDAASSARSNGRPAGEALKHGLRDAAADARREFQKGMRHSGYWRTCPPHFGPARYRRGARGYGANGYGSVPRGDGPPDPGPPQGGPYRGPFPPGRPAGPWPPYGRSASRRETRSPLPPVRRKWDASVLAGLLIVVFGMAWLVGGLGVVHLSTEAVVAAGLMLLGASLVVTARTDWSLSRHAWPVILGAVLVVGLFATSTSFGVTGALSHVSFGDMTPTVVPNQTVYGGFGQLTVNVPPALPDGSTVHVENIAGDTRINLPPDATVTVHTRVLAGQVCMNGKAIANGVGATSGPLQTGNGPSKITIDVHQLAGQVVIGTPGCAR